jgi:feruloyl esterase
MLREPTPARAALRRSFVRLMMASCVMALHTPAAPAATAEQCSVLADTDFARVLDAPTRVVAATVVAATGSLPAYCRVEGYVAPQVGIEFHLPMAGWNGKLIVAGCGGMCGSLQGLESCPEALARGYACGTTDMGHRAPSMDGKWAYDNPVAEIDVGHRATHVATLAGKAIATAFYDAPIQRAYFRGCSTGGRQGLVEAQRYPYDFDGVIAGAPILYTPMGPPLGSLWNATANLDSRGEPIMSAAKLERLRAAVLDSCDAVDGLKDGVINDPRACKFDVGSLACHGAAGDDCLTADELAVVRKFYQGPRGSPGVLTRVGGQQFGSEGSWTLYLKGKDTPFYRFATENLRYLGFALDPGPDYDASQFDWNRDPQRLSYSLLSAGNPDLGLFADHGGKLILFHGWADPAISTSSTIAYYEMVTRTMGGLAATQQFARMYLLPGMGHCEGGGVNFVDLLTALESWVEGGRAPDLLTGYALAGPIGPNVAPAGFTGTNIGAAHPSFARPLFPYPDTARYVSGDPNNSSSFKRVPTSGATIH